MDISTLFYNVWELWQMSKFSKSLSTISQRCFTFKKKDFINNAWATLISATVQANICSSNSSFHCCRYICVALTHNGCIRESWYSVFKSEMSRRVLCNSQNRTYIHIDWHFCSMVDGLVSAQSDLSIWTDLYLKGQRTDTASYNITKTYTNSQSHFVKVFHVGSN